MFCTTRKKEREGDLQYSVYLTIFMICYYHSNREAVGTCPGCGKNLCKDCFDLTTGHYCYDCAKNSHDEVKAELKGGVIWCSIVLIATAIFIFFFTGPQMFKEQGIVGGIIYVLACFFPAWKICTRLADRILGDRLYAGMMLIAAFVIKVLLALLISAIVPIIYLINLFINIHRFRFVKKDMEAIEVMHQNNLSVSENQE
ncbi:hypothetical protein EI71_00610 [Anaeroplasma bactoclasticum]|jgi:hypothetical protein|uniref:B box-type domain-containing protein n=2 Tax=Anaeroplasma bactoclasticum TaxID=2088 RepID=A0A397RV14_9MOLU|nr:hypothetical protein EI71_00610 [Anaeroplasma bactoclasticum]